MSNMDHIHVYIMNAYQQNVMYVKWRQCRPIVPRTYAIHVHDMTDTFSAKC